MVEVAFLSCSPCELSTWKDGISCSFVVPSPLRSQYLAVKLNDHPHFILLQMFVSSAYINILVLSSILSLISFKNETKRVGPRIEPCSTPEVTCLQGENELSKTTE